MPPVAPPSAEAMRTTGEEALMLIVTYSTEAMTVAGGNVLCEQRATTYPHDARIKGGGDLTATT